MEIVDGEPPVAVDNEYTVAEDMVLSVSAAGVLANDTDADSATITVQDEDPSTPGSIEPVEDVRHGTLVLAADGSFEYTPDRDFFGTDTFVYNARDSRLQSLAAATVTITVTPVNDQPTANDDEITVAEDTVVVRSGDVFTVNDRKGQEGFPSQTNELGQTLSVVGAVILSPAEAVAGATVAVANNELTLTPPVHYNNEINGPILVELTIQDAGVAGADAMPLTDTSTLTINLLAVNDPPEYNMPTEHSTTEDAGLVTEVNFITDIMPGPADALDEATGPAIATEDQQVSFQVQALDESLFAVLPQITPTTDASPGTLTYQLAPHVNSVTPFPSILVEVIAVDTGDDGGPSDDMNASAPRTFTILPAPVNDAPEFDIPNATVSIQEDQGQVVVAGFLTDIRPGPLEALDEVVQTLSVNIVADSNAFAGAAGFPTIDPTTGDLTFETGSHFNQFTGQDFEVVVTLIDDGGTALNGVDRTSKTFTIDVAELNDAPEFDMPTVTSAFQEDPNADPSDPIVVNGFVTNIMPGPAAATDEGPAREDQQVSFAVTALDPSLFDPAFLPTIDASGTLTYRLSPDVNEITPFPVILVEVIASDTGANDGGTAVPRNINQADPRTFTILPDPINDAPEFTIPDIISLQEDAGPTTVADFVTDARPGPVTALDELASQSLTVIVEPLDATAFTASGQPAITLDAVAGTGILTFETNTDVNRLSGHDLRVRVTLQDDGGVVNAGDVDSTTKTFTLSVDPINDAPSFDIASPEVTVFEDQEEVSGNTPTVIAGFASNVTQGPATALDETTLVPQNLTFIIVSVSDPTLFEVQPEISASGDLSFVTAQDQNGQAIVVTHLIDDGADATTGNGNENQSQPDQTFTINLTAVNDPPEFTVPATTNSVEDQGFVRVVNFATGLRPGPLSAADEVGQEFTVNVQAVDPTAFAVQPAVAADGTLTYQTATHVNSDNADLRVTMFLTDNGTPSPTPDNNTSPTVTFTIVTEAVNDPPAFTLPNAEVSVIEDVEQFEGTTITSFPNFATGLVPGPASASDEAGQTLSFEILSVSAPELFEVQPSISNPNGVPGGELSFKTASNRNGTAFVAVRVLDSGAAIPAPNDNASPIQTLTINITPINDAPLFDLPPSISVDEDAGVITQTGFATNIRRGPAGTDDENAQLVNFVATASDPSAFSIAPTIDAGGTLTFQTAPNVNSLTANLEVVVQLFDNGPFSPTPHVNASAPQTFTINVAAVNDSPIADAFSQAGTEDTPVTVQAADVLVGDVPGPTPDESGQSLSMTQIERTSTRGGTITPVFNGNEIVSFTYVPPLNFAGEDTFLYVVTDDGVEPKSGSGTITITLAAVNDAPQFIRGADQVVTEDADLVTVEGWATGIMAGPPAATDEQNTQTVSFLATADDPSLFETQPAVDSNGVLTYKPAANANGSTFVTVTAIDDGIPSMMSESHTFSITVEPVNDPPVFTPGPDVTVAEDSNAFSLGWAANIAPAAGLLADPATATDEANQVVDFEVNVDRPELFSVQPTIDSLGQLEFTPGQDASGSAVLSVTAVDRGSSVAPNQNRSATVELTITITPQNDSPVAVGDTFTAEENEVLAVAAPGLLANDTDVDLPNETLTAIPETITSLLGATVVINSDGSFTYDPAAVNSIQQLTSGQNVQDTFIYSIQDSGDIVSSPAVVAINVNGFDDPPIAVNDTYSLGVGQSRLLDVLSNDVDVDTPLDPTSITITRIPINGTAVVNQTGSIEYTAGPGFRGQDTVGYTVRDASGNLSNEALVTVTINDAPTALDDNAFTIKNEPIDIAVLNNDSDSDGTIDPNTVEIVVAPSSGTAEVQNDGTIRYTPAVDFFGEVQFSYVVSDNVGTPSNVADVAVQVQRSRWQNPQGNLDVNADGFVSPIDSLLIINYGNGNNEPFLPDSGIEPAPFLDPSGDEFVTAIDWLLVINFLNTPAGEGEAEGEAVTQTDVQMVTPDQVLEAVGADIVRETERVLDESLVEVTSPDRSGVVPMATPLPEEERQEALLERATLDALARPEGEGSQSVSDAVDQIFADLDFDE